MAKLSLARAGTGEKPAQVTGQPEPVKMPAGLSGDQRFWWRRWSPRAIKKRTLTENTIPGFLELIDAKIKLVQMTDDIDRDGIVFTRHTLGPDGQEWIESKTVHPLLPAYSKQVKQVEILLARYGLAAYGKAEPELPKTPEANPWANLNR